MRDSVKQHPFREGFAANEEISRIFGNLPTIKKKHTKALVHASKVNDLEVNADKLDTWSCLETATQKGAIMYIFIIVTLKERESSNIFEKNFCKETQRSFSSC
jgi:hypothetical protein